MNKNCGIYLIKNESNNKVYVGSSKNIKSRIWHHKNCLKHNRHSNSYLQNSWNKYTEEVFTFHKLEYCSIEELFERELWWMELFQSVNDKFGYNLVEVTLNGGPGHNEKTKAKISKGRKRWHRENPDKSNSKRVKVVDFSTDPFSWKDFSSITEALQYYKIDRDHISNYIDKRAFQDKAFINLNKPEGYSRLKKTYIKWLKGKNGAYTKATPIYALNLKTNQIEEFKSQNQFYKLTGRKLNRTILTNGHKVSHYRPVYNTEALQRWVSL